MSTIEIDEQHLVYILMEARLDASVKVLRAMKTLIEGGGESFDPFDAEEAVVVFSGIKDVTDLMQTKIDFFEADRKHYSELLKEFI